MVTSTKLCVDQANSADYRVSGHLKQVMHTLQSNMAGENRNTYGGWLRNPAPKTEDFASH